MAHKTAAADTSMGVSGPNLKALSTRHSSFNAGRSKHYHDVVVGKTYSGPTRMTQRRGQRDNQEESDEKL